MHIRFHISPVGRLWDSALLSSWCFLTAFSSFLHPLTSLISNLWNPGKACKQEMQDMERLLRCHQKTCFGRDPGELSNSPKCLTHSPYLPPSAKDRRRCWAWGGSVLGDTQGRSAFSIDESVPFSCCREGDIFTNGAFPPKCQCFSQEWSYFIFTVFPTYTVS